VGAHTTHLLGGALGTAVSCSECHVVPENVDDLGHIDSDHATVTWGPLSRTASVAAEWDRASLTCKAYCHGASLSGGTLTRPVWNVVDGSQAACGTCHGLPPPAPHPANDRCETCHAPVAGPRKTIADPTRHVDGKLDFSTTGCAGCHGDPPAPGDESYSGGAGAHAPHLAIGLDCKTCHGHDGSGPTHDQGNGIVLRKNVDVVFDVSVRFPSGTTMDNGRASKWDPPSSTCAVGCHNPIVGKPPEAPNLDNAIVWTGVSPACVGCHDQVGTAPPLDHAIAEYGDVACLTCHDLSKHTQGTTMIDKPNPSDANAYAPGDIDGLCNNCHDGAQGTTFFGGQTPRATGGFSLSLHGMSGLRCSSCHDAHSSNGGPLFVDRRTSLCLPCHASVGAEIAPVPNAPSSHHPMDPSMGAALTCIDCHNPHIVEPAPAAAIDPSDKWTLMQLPQQASDFCMRCHAGASPAMVPPAFSILAAIMGGPDAFNLQGSSLHNLGHGGLACTSCHTWHGSPGPSGINRGRMLLPSIIINQYDPAMGYAGQSSCGTPSGCHGG
jgi:predicted CXXCH cytochrome family protein